MSYHHRGPRPPWYAWLFPIAITLAVVIGLNINALTDLFDCHAKLMATQTQENEKHRAVALATACGASSVLSPLLCDDAQQLQVARTLRAQGYSPDAGLVFWYVLAMWTPWLLLIASAFCGGMVAWQHKSGKNLQDVADQVIQERQGLAEDLATHANAKATIEANAATLITQQATLAKVKSDIEEQQEILADLNQQIEDAKENSKEASLVIEAAKRPKRT